MRVRISLLILLAALAVSASAKDVYLTIGGTVGNGGVGSFRTDLRIFNPSTTKDIQIVATFLPTNTDNTNATSKTITVNKRQMAIYDDAITALFTDTRLGGIKLSSSDDFVATQKIYSVATNGTLGQFIPGLDGSLAKKTGVVIQLKSNGGSGQQGTFRSNLGFLNTSNVTANVNLHLYDKNNATIGATKALTLQPFGTTNPTEVHALFPDAGSADLSDAWVSFQSDQAILAYGSVVDNGTTDPTYITSSEDTGSSALSTTPAPTAKVLTVLEKNNLITVTGADQLKVGDTVTVQVSVTEGPHGFALLDPDGFNAIPSHGATSPGTSYSETFTVTKQGTYGFFCTNTGCGAHTNMSGSFVIGTPSSDPYRPGY